MKKLQKKTAKIEVRIESSLKESFAQYAKENNTTISTLLRDYIKEIVNNGKWSKKSN